MREHKFRGIRKFDNRWCYGYYCPVWQSGARYPAMIETEHSGRWHTLIKGETLGEFTGYYDRNGREIYEGDLISVQSSHEERLYGKKKSIMLVKWSKRAGSWVCLEPELNVKGEDVIDYLDSLTMWLVNDKDMNKVNLYVRGNIHEDKKIYRK